MAADVLSANDLSFLYTLQMPQQQGSNFVRVLWSADGRTVCAAGQYRSGAVHPILCWGDAGRGRMSTFPVASDTVTDIRALHNGAIAFSSNDGSVGILDPTGVTQWRAAPDLLDFRVADSLLVSSDGNNVKIAPYFFNGTTWTTRHTINFSVADETLKTDTLSTISLQSPITGGLAIDGWAGDHPTLDGRALPLLANEISDSLAISSNKDSFVLGTEWNIRKFDLKGSQVWSIPIPDVA